MADNKQSEHKRVELVWPGKRTEIERVRLPFQTIERVNDVRRAAGEQGGLLTTASQMPDWWPEDWRNRLIWGDNKYAIASLLDEFAGKVDLIYIDPPFDTGADFSVSAQIGDTDLEKMPSAVEEMAYRDTWGEGVDSYLSMVYERLLLIRDLLAPNGSLWVHVGWQVSHQVRLLLEELFGRKNYVNEVIWKRQSAHNDTRQGADHLGRIHETLHYVRKGADFVLNMQYEPYSEETRESAYRYVEEGTNQRYSLGDITAPGGNKAGKGNPYYEFLGVSRYWRFSRERMQELYDAGRIVQTAPGRVPLQKRYLNEMPGVSVQDLWLSINPIGPQAKERTNYDTQKPEALLERVIRTSSNAGGGSRRFLCRFGDYSGSS